MTTAPVLYLPAEMATPAAVAVRTSAMWSRDTAPASPDYSHGRRSGGRNSRVEGLLLPSQSLRCTRRSLAKCTGGMATSSFSAWLKDKRSELAQGMIENFFFEIENYGAILNANRTYFFTRSQPPFLSSMIREIYEQPGLESGFARRG